MPEQPRRVQRPYRPHVPSYSECDPKDVERTYVYGSDKVEESDMHEIQKHTGACGVVGEMPDERDTLHDTTGMQSRDAQVYIREFSEERVRADAGDAGPAEDGGGGEGRGAGGTRRVGEEAALSAEELRFCTLYASAALLGDSEAAYVRAYGLDVEERGVRTAAKRGAEELLNKRAVLAHIQMLLLPATVDSAAVDREMAFLILQKSDLASKRAAIAEYNRIHKRGEEDAQATLTLDLVGLLDAVDG